MKILLSGGFKTENIANAIRPKFESNGDEIVVEMFVENIENLYLRGESFDKIIVTEQSLTQDFKIKDDNVVRNRINTFAQQQELHDNKIVFLTQYAKLASTILDEIVSIKDKSIIVLKQPRYTVTFFQELITSDFSQLPREWIYNLETAIQNDTENYSNNHIEETQNTNTNDETVWEEEPTEQDTPSEFETPGFEDTSEWTNQDSIEQNTPEQFGLDDPNDWTDTNEWTDTANDFDTNTGDFDTNTTDWADTENNFDTNTGDFDTNTGDFDTNTGDWADTENNFDTDTSDFDTSSSDFDTNANEVIANADCSDTNVNDFDTDETDWTAQTNEFDTNANGSDASNNDWTNSTNDFDTYTNEFDTSTNTQGNVDFDTDTNEFESNTNENDQWTNENDQWTNEFESDTNNTSTEQENVFNDAQNNDFETFSQNNEFENDTYVNQNETQWNEQQSFSPVTLQKKESYEPHDNEQQSFSPVTLQKKESYEPQNNDSNDSQVYAEQQNNDFDSMQNYTETPNETDTNWEEPEQTFEEPNNYNNIQASTNSTAFIGIPMPQQNNTQSFGDFEESSGNQDNNADDWEEQSTSDFNNDIYENPNNSQVNYGNDVNNMSNSQFNDGLYENNAGYNNQNNMSNGNNASLGNQNQGSGNFDISDYDNNRAQSFNDDIYNETPQDFQPVNTSVPPMMQGMNINKIMIQLQNELKPFANRGNSIVFTGCGGCGTSILAYSIAKLASVLGFNTLLVDMDTEGRAQDYISRDNYISMNTDGASLMAAINSGASVESNVTKPNPGLSLLTMGIGGDTAPVNDIIHKEKISRFVNAAKSKYHFVIYDIPFKDATSYLSEITYNADNLALVIDASNWGMTKAMINVCNIPSEEMQSTIFNKSQIIFNKYRGMQEFMGKKIRNMQDVLRITDDKVMELVGEDIGCYFSDMSIVGVINEDPNFEMGWFNTKQYVDTQAGQMMFCNLLRNIVLNK